MEYTGMVAKIYTAGKPSHGNGIITVEADILPGNVGMQIVGLPDTSVRECRDRIRSAISHNNFFFPVKYIVVNLAPNDMPKEGALAELAIAAAILCATGQLEENIFENALLLGSLGLDGRIMSAQGLLAAAISARTAKNIKRIIFPAECSSEFCHLPGLELYPIEKLSQLKDFSQGKIQCISPLPYESEQPQIQVDMAQIKGNDLAKTALCVTAIGRHHAMMIGEPGAGKTMLARAFEGILPQLTLQESLEITKVYSLAGLTQGKLITRRPFRSPHHTTSDIALVGGGQYPQPGEISLAHKGVLFLDELLEFRNSSIQALREPLEERKISVSRARGSVSFPADFILLAATNPCRCGYVLSRRKVCSCKKNLVLNQFRKIMGPFMDRISIEVDLSHPAGPDEHIQACKDSSMFLSQITEARLRMYHRNKGLENSQLPPEILEHLYSSIPNWELLRKNIQEKFCASYRGFINTLRVCLSLTDYYEITHPTESILLETLNFRVFRQLESRILRDAA